jgi:CRP-like cAMP-binding protein
MREGKKSTHVVLLLDACVKVTAIGDEGHLALLAIRVGGDIVGELSSLDERPRSATITTAGPAVVRLITQAEFHAFLSDYPDAALALSRSVGAKLRSATKRRVDFGGSEAKVRLARVLAELASSYGEHDPAGVRIGVNLTQPEWAALVGAAEPTVHKCLADLRRSGVLSTGYRRLIVRDLAALRLIAGLPQHE